MLHETTLMNNSQSLLTKERKTVPIGATFTLACTFSGVGSFLFSEHSFWMQWTVLLHLITGIVTTLLLLPYFGFHFRRTIGVRRMTLLLSGLLSGGLFFIFIASGWQLLLHGQQENQRWVYHVHVLSSLIFVGVVILHLFLHVKRLPKRRKQRDEQRFPSIQKGDLRLVIVSNVVIQLVVLIIAFISQQTLTPPNQKPVVAEYQYSYGTHRFRPSQTETSNGAFMETAQVANSHRCMSCHEDVTNQWMSSVHKQAASDPSYVTNVILLAEKKGISATRYCEGCHAPIALLTGELSPGGKHGGIAGTVANIEGISCMSCHGIDSLVHLKGVASYQFRPAQGYLFTKSNNPVLRRVHDLLIRVKPDQHKKDLGKPLFKDPKFCSSCHTQFMDKDMNDWGWVAIQDDYGAWLESPFSRQHEEGFANSQTSRCQDCHMPLTHSDDPSADHNGLIRSHNFPGANTFIPVINSDKKQLDVTRTFLQANKMRISIDKPSRKDAVQTLLVLDEKLRSFDEGPFYYYLGEQSEIHVVVTNNGVGHDFPGGSIDINQVWIEFLVLDAEGRKVYSSGEIDDNNFVDEQAYFYRSLPVDRNGKLVWRHDLFNMVGESFKRVIKSGESDIVDFQFSIPAWVKSPLTVTATLKYRKLNERYARWALKDKYIKIPIIDMAWDSLSIPVKVRKEVE